MRRFAVRLLNLFRRRPAERELAREVDSHLGLLEEEFGRRGLTPEEARFAALREYGSVEYAKDLHRDARGFPWLEQSLKDVRFGARSLLRTPGFTAIAVLTLALGIGANTALFSVVNAVLLRPLAYRDPDRLVTILHGGSDPVAPANFLDWRGQSRSFELMAAAEFWSPNLTGSYPPEHIRGHRMTRNLLSALGVQPLIGRAFLPGDDRGVVSNEVILSHGLWLRRFGADPGVLGRKIVLDGDPYTIVGVMPRDFAFSPFWAPRGELWAPLALGERALSRGGNSLRVFARLRRGVTIDEARSEMTAVTARLERQFPGSNRDVQITPLAKQVVGNVEAPLRILSGAVGFVLLIACANVSHMLLARTSSRQKEIAVRMALGAGRTRLVGQFLTENLLLATLGGTVGLLAAWWGVRALIALSPANLPRVETVRIDASVALFLAGITVITAMLFGLAPAMHVGVDRVAEALKEGGRGASDDGVRRGRLRAFLIASEFAMAFVLLTGAGLVLRSFIAIERIDPGFDPRSVLSMVVSVAGTSEAEPGRREGFYRELLAKAQALPGVRSVSAINHLPLAGDMWGLPFLIEGGPRPRPGELPSAVYRAVMPGYFETMRIPLVRGRGVGISDDKRSPGVVVINERAADLFWPGQDPIGRRVTFETAAGAAPTWLTIVGICRNARQLDWAATPYPEVYLALLQNHDYLERPQPHYAYITLVARTDGKPTALAEALKQTVWSMDRNLPISQILTLEEAVSRATAQPRFEMALFGAFAAVALVLAAAGVYGVVSYSVSRRTHEIGIRMSLGASARDVLWMVTRQGIAEAAFGITVGLAGALLLARLLSGMLYEVGPADPLTFALASLTLIGAALLAVWIPARRASAIEPVIALRSE
ncbi:MAG: ABC transporter permease [Acidobacteria bacterium]|nr:ABC transporter permease [Acidobacteriota bacterium]